MTPAPTYGELLDSFEDQRLLVEIGRDLMRIRDTERLFRRILDVSRQMTGADAGSIFLTETIGDQPKLRFKYSCTISRDLPYEEFVMPRTVGSIAGYVSLTGHSLNISDVYRLDKDQPFTFNDSFDMAHGYRTKSMLAVPMTDHTGAVVGVIQLLNSKEPPNTYGNKPDAIILQTPDDFENLVVPFKDRYVPLMEAVAAQAAVALENATMVKRIQSQFEQFVAAAVEAVEARDPATSGHSARVAMNAVSLAREMNRRAETSGGAIAFSADQITELEYAGLLHDFGKVYIDPAIFLKAKKLYPGDLSRLRLRLRYLRRSIEFDYAKKPLSADPIDRERMESERESAIAELLEILRLIEELNEPSMTTEDPVSVIQRINNAPIPRIRGVDDEDIPVLTEEEIFNLSVRRGSLNPDERKEIERHVVRSYEFVKRIPWPAEYAGIPSFIRAHHEALDGSGYPDGITAERIPPQSRILSIVDIYDALTAADRPYKKAAPPERAIGILQDEANRGRLDSELVEVFAAMVLPR